MRHRPISQLLTVPLLALLLTVPALAQTDQELTDLKTLFEKDPAAGFPRRRAMVTRLACCSNGLDTGRQ